MAAELEIIREAAAEVTGADSSSITRKTRFVEDLGADSLDLLNILIKVEEETRVPVDNAVFQNVSTVGEAEELLIREEHRA